MKLLLLFFSTLLSIHQINAQTTAFSEIGETYEFAGNVLLDKCNKDGTLVVDANGATERGLVKKFWLFTVVDELANGDKVVYVNEFTESPTLNRAYFSAAPSKTPDIFFLITASKFSEISRKPEGSWSFGTVLMPLKLRFGYKDSGGNNTRYFDFTSEVNIGLSIARRLSARKAANKLYFIGSIGTTSIPVEAATTDGLITEKTNVSAFSPTLGLLFNFQDSGLQLAVSTGIDYMTGELSRKWVYKYQPFIGIGLGFSIFKFGDKGENTK